MSANGSTDKTDFSQDLLLGGEGGCLLASHFVQNTDWIIDQNAVGDADQFASLYGDATVTDISAFVPADFNFEVINFNLEEVWNSAPPVSLSSDTAITNYLPTSSSSHFVDRSLRNKDHVEAIGQGEDPYAVLQNLQKDVGSVDVGGMQLSLGSGWFGAGGFQMPVDTFGFNGALALDMSIMPANLNREDTWMMNRAPPHTNLLDMATTPNTYNFGSNMSSYELAMLQVRTVDVVSESTPVAALPVSAQLPPTITTVSGPAHNPITHGNPPLAPATNPEVPPVATGAPRISGSRPRAPRRATNATNGNSTRRPRRVLNATADFLCPIDNCSLRRNQHGNGFNRKDNLNTHMRLHHGMQVTVARGRPRTNI